MRGRDRLTADGQEVTAEDTDDVIRQKVEKQVHKHSHEFEWHDDRSISVTHRVPGKPGFWVELIKQRSVFMVLPV